MVRSVSLAFCFLMGAAALGAANKEQARLENAGVVMEEILNVPDNIPLELLQKAECVIVIPSMVKVALGIGGTYGRGAMVCRTGKAFDGPWAAPAMYTLEGGSVGFQLSTRNRNVPVLSEIEMSPVVLCSSTKPLEACGRCAKRVCAFCKNRWARSSASTASAASIGRVIDHSGLARRRPAESARSRDATDDSHSAATGGESLPSAALGRSSASRVSWKTAPTSRSIA